MFAFQFFKPSMQSCPKETLVLKYKLYIQTKDAADLSMQQKHLPVYLIEWLNLTYRYMYYVYFKNTPPDIEYVYYKSCWFVHCTEYTLWQHQLSHISLISASSHFTYIKIILFSGNFILIFQYLYHRYDQIWKGNLIISTKRKKHNIDQYL